jgi:hypothetical protein
MSIQKLISIDNLLESFLKSIQLKTASIHHIDMSFDSMGVLRAFSNVGILWMCYRPMHISDLDHTFGITNAF